jgi:hypothetical protein
MAKVIAPKTRRRKISALLRRRWLDLSKRLADDMVKRIEGVPQGEWDAAQAKSKRGEP